MLGILILFTFIVIVGARQEPVDTLDDALTLLDAGTALRHVGSTNMNELSSRSHCIFKLKLGMGI